MTCYTLQAVQLAELQHRKAELQTELQPLELKMINYDSDLVNGGIATVQIAAIQKPILKKKMEPLISQLEEVSVNG
jgi:hypothetical protein